MKIDVTKRLSSIEIELMSVGELKDVLSDCQDLFEVCDDYDDTFNVALHNCIFLRRRIYKLRSQKNALKQQLKVS